MVAWASDRTGIGAATWPSEAHPLLTEDRTTSRAPGGEPGIAMSRLEVRLTQALSVAFGFVLVAVAIVSWWPADPPSGQTVSKATTTVVTGGGASKRPATPRKTTVQETVRTVNGTAGPGQHLEPLNQRSRRSETLVAVLVGAGAILVLLGCLYPRLRGASGAGAGVLLDPISLMQKRAKQRRAADSRLPDDVDDRASALLQSKLEATTAPTTSTHVRKSTRADDAASSRDLDALIEETLSVFVQQPEIRTGDERYVGDFVAPSNALSPTSSTIGRILFFPAADRFDVVRAGADVAWGSDSAKRNTSRYILVHASGNRPPAESVVERFALDHGHKFVPGKPWTLPLSTVLKWIDQHWSISGGGSTESALGQHQPT